jgi:hypothetical protein
MHISEKLGKKYTVITVNQALYFKLMDLKWSVPRYKDSVFPRLGGLHIAMNFMKCIGDHMNGSGLHEIWVESDLLGPIAAEQVLYGKHYNGNASTQNYFPGSLEIASSAIVRILER